MMCYVSYISNLADGLKCTVLKKYATGAISFWFVIGGSIKSSDFHWKFNIFSRHIFIILCVHLTQSNSIFLDRFLNTCTIYINLILCVIQHNIIGQMCKIL